MKVTSHLPSSHLRNDQFGDPHDRVNVHLDDIVDCLVGFILKEGGDFMVGTHIVD